MDPRWEAIFKQNKKVEFSSLLKQLEKIKFNKTFKIIHVVGTNGKGSVSNHIAEGLQEKGLKVGLFTSPHIVKPNERIKVNGKEITNKDFFEIQKELDKDLNFFACTYLVALKHFENAKCDYVVMEAGIGGRRDATKFVQGEYGVVTSISKDHTEILGSTLEEIAKDKSGIIGPKMHFAIPSAMDAKLQEYFVKEVLDNNAIIEVIDNEAKKYRDRNIKLAKGFLASFFKIYKDSFKPIQGRTESFVHNGQTTIFDVGHNEDGVKESLKQINDKYDQVVIAFKDTKDVSEIKNMFEGKEIFYHKVNSHFQDFDEFKKIENIKEFYKNQDKSTLYIGSFFLIGELCKLRTE